MAKRVFGLLGVPSSAGAHWPGQEKGPAAMRAASLSSELANHGITVEDHGDLPRTRMVPDRGQPQSVESVAQVARLVSERTRHILQAGQIPLVLGGDCTIELGVLSAFLQSGLDPGLMYIDGGVDLYTPLDNPTGILDSMGIAHMLGEPGTANALGRIGPRHPLMEASAIVLFGHGPEPCDASLERVTAAKQRMTSFPATMVRGAASLSARQALSVLEARGQPFAVHFDVDVIDFVDAPLADVPLIKDGISFDDAFEALKIFVASDLFKSLTVTELNPDHGAEDGSTTRRFVKTLAETLAARTT